MPIPTTFKVSVTNINFCKFTIFKIVSIKVMFQAEYVSMFMSGFNGSLVLAKAEKNLPGWHAVLLV